MVLKLGKWNIIYIQLAVVKWVKHNKYVKDLEKGVKSDV